MGNEIVLDNYRGLIQDHARVAFRKIRKPSQYELEDLEQEGFEVFLWVKKRFDPMRGVNFKTLLIKILRSHFATIVNKTYRVINSITSEYEETTSYGWNPLDLVDTLSRLTQLGEKEISYLIFLLTPPSSATTVFKDCQPRHLRSLVRDLLSISRDQECEIRKNLKEAFV